MAEIKDVLKSGLSELDSKVDDVKNKVNSKSQTSETENAEDSFEDAIDTKALAKKLDIDEKYIVDDLHMTNLEKEENPYTKSDLTGVKTVTEEQGGDRIDKLDDGESKEISDGTLTKNEDGTVHCKSDYLGEFDYNPDLFAYGYKEIKEDDGTTSQLPVLKYVGKSGTDGAGSNGLWGLHDLLGDKTLGGMNFTCHSTFELPEGLKSGDYTFEGNEDLIFQPRLPDSLESGHYMFANCKKLEYGSYEAKDGEFFLTNSGGEIYFPKGFEDGSNMYKGSKEFKGDFGDAPSTLVNAQGMFEGTSLGEKGEGAYFWYEHKVPSWGGKITPYLTSEYAKNAFNDNSNENVKDVAKNSEYVIDDQGEINDDYADYVEEGKKDGSIDEDKLSESQSAAGLQHEEEVYNGDVLSETEIASNNSLSDNLVYNSKTGLYEYDQTGEVKSDDKGADSWQRWVIDGAAGLGIGGLTSKVTGSKLVGIAAGVGSVYLLDKNNILPKSFAPVLTATANMLPDGQIKDKLNEWATKVSGSTVDEQKAELTPDKVAGMHQENRLERSVASSSSVMVQDVSKSMYQNGQAAATSMAMWSTATKGEDSAKIVNEYVVSKSTGAMEEQWASEIKDGSATDKQKEEMKSYYTKMFDALESYNKGAKEGIESAFSNDETRKELSLEGLSMVNRSYTEGVMDSFVKMNEKYQFMSEDDLIKMQESMPSVDGIGKLTDYKDSSSFDELREEASVKTASLVSLDEENQADNDTKSDYVPDYGTSKDSVNYKSSKTTDKSTDKSDSKSDEKDTSASGKKHDARVAAAEQISGNVQDSVESEDDYVYPSKYTQ